jgi:hypothetical protein
LYWVLAIWEDSAEYCADCSWDWTNAAGFPDLSDNDGPMKW